MILALIVAGVLGVGLYHCQSELDAAKRRVAELEAPGKSVAPTPEKLAPALAPEEKKPVLESLKPLLKVENEEVRARAVELTALVAPKESDLLLDQVLRSDPSVRVKLTTLDVIGKQKIAYCRGEVLNLLKSEDPALRRKAAWSLGALGKDADAETMKKVREELHAALKAENEAWVKALIAATSKNATPPPKGPDGSEPPLAIQAYGSHGPYIQALGEVGDAETAKRLQFYLESKDPLVRRETALALGRIGAPDSAPSLLSSFRSEHDALVSSAIISVLTNPVYKMKYDARTRAFTQAQ
jgi:hypothetical protein